MRAEVSALDGDRPVYAVSTGEGRFTDGLSSRTAALWLLGVFSALAIGLAALGVFGVLSYAVSQRVREIGIRVALGSSRQGIIRLVVSRAMWPLGLGLAAGIAGVWFGRTLLGSWLFGVEPEAGVLIVAAGVIFLIGFLSALRPAWSASRLSPLNALRNS
jgi:ABC-type antimicrobial peptide transport system permease subunit